MSQDDRQREVSEIFLITRVSAPYRGYLVRYLAEQLRIPAEEICLGAAYAEPAGAAATAEPATKSVPSRIAALRHHWQASTSVIKRISESEAPGVIVHGYNDPAFIRVMIKCKRRGIPVFLRGDSNLRDDRNKTPYIIIAKRIYLRFVRTLVDGAMPVGSLGLAYYRYYGWDPSNLFPVPFAIDVKHFQAPPNQADLDVFLAHAGVPAGRRLIIYSGRLESMKRVDLLLTAFAQMAEEIGEWDLVIAGSGSLEQDLRRLVPTSLSDRVHWLGWCNQDRLRIAYHSAEVLVLPSERDAWAIVINEAIVAGLIPVASDAVGSAADLIADGVSGYVFASGDVTDLKRAMLGAVAADHTVRDNAVERYERFWRDRNPAVGVTRAFESVGYAIAR